MMSHICSKVRLQQSKYITSDDSIPNDHKWGYAMKLRVMAAFLKSLYFVIFIALSCNGIEHS